MKEREEMNNGSRTRRLIHRRYREQEREGHNMRYVGVFTATEVPRGPDCASTA